VTASRIRRGRLIVLEGIDGAGKTSVQRSLLRRWKTEGVRVVGRREPTDPVLGRQAVAAGPDDPALAALYFTLDRILARPEVDRLRREGTSVLQDRSFYSTLVYQGSRLPSRQGRELERLQRQIAPRPDWVVLLDVDAPEGLDRVDRSRRGRSPIERLALLRAASREYRRFARRERWIVLDASAALDEVVDELDRRFRPRLTRAGRASGTARLPGGRAGRRV
jgi:dTMP kinase